jgi:citrate lyase beta subunit
MFYALLTIVPTSSDRMLEKSLTTTSDVIIYDLEDSIPPGPSDKDTARQRLKIFLTVRLDSEKYIDIALSMIIGDFLYGTSTP